MFQIAPSPLISLFAKQRARNLIVSHLIVREVFKKMPNTKINKEQASVLSNVKIEQLSKQPIIENSISKSEDGKWLIHRTVITDIKPVTYFEKVLGH